MSVQSSQWSGGIPGKGEIDYSEFVHISQGSLLQLQASPSCIASASATHRGIPLHTAEGRRQKAGVSPLGNVQQESPLEHRRQHSRNANSNSQHADISLRRTFPRCLGQRQDPVGAMTSLIGNIHCVLQECKTFIFRGGVVWEHVHFQPLTHSGAEIILRITISPPYRARQQLCSGSKNWEKWNLEGMCPHLRYSLYFSKKKILIHLWQFLTQNYYL